MRAFTGFLNKFKKSDYDRDKTGTIQIINGEIVQAPSRKAQALPASEMETVESPPSLEPVPEAVHIVPVIPAVPRVNKPIERPEPKRIDAPRSVSAPVLKSKPELKMESEPEPTHEEQRGRLPKVDRFFDDYLKVRGRAKSTINEYRWRYGWWEREAEKIGKSVYNLSYKDIEALVKNVSPATTRSRVAVLNTLGKWYLREGKPKLFEQLAKFDSPKLPKRLPGDLGPDVFIDYRELAKDWCAMHKIEGVWLGLKLNCGLRISEIKTLTFKGQNQIKVIGKGNKERILPCPEWLLIALRTIPKEGRKGWAKDRRFIWRKLADEGIRHPHTLRHTFASECMRRGKSIEDIRNLLGHDNIATTSIYAKLQVPDDVAELLDE